MNETSQNERIKQQESENAQTDHSKKKKSKMSSKDSHDRKTKDIAELKNKITEAELKLNEYHDKYLRLSAEFDNYRKRTIREKSEYLKSASEETLKNILPVLDDFERALISSESSKDVDAVRQGIVLIHSKLKDVLAQMGLKEIDAYSKEFDTDLHEAMTKVPAQDEDMKGKVVEVIQKGYFLNDKVIRFAKVVVGE